MIDKGHYWAKKKVTTDWTVVFYAFGHVVAIGSADLQKESEYIFGEYIEMPEQKSPDT